MSHNPEGAGSNPAPATIIAGQDPLPVQEEGFLLWSANEFANGLAPAPGGDRVLSRSHFSDYDQVTTEGASWRC